jgi:predicted transglutaminase-like cysteine proteinase
MRVLDTARADNEWRSPLTALSRTAGDCKYFAVLKYAALREAGLHLKVLKIVIVEVRSLLAGVLVNELPGNVDSGGSRLDSQYRKPLFEKMV